MLSFTLSRKCTPQLAFLTHQHRHFSKRYYIVNYKYEQDAYYKRIPMKSDRETQVQKLLNNSDTKILTAPHFPYDENTMLIEHEDNNQPDGGLEYIKKFV